MIRLDLTILLFKSLIGLLFLHEKFIGISFWTVLIICGKHKGLQIWAYVVMSNHVHCISSSENGNLPVYKGL